MNTHYPGEEKVKESFYRNIFVAKFNLAEERDAHKLVANEEQKLMKNLAISGNTDNSTRVICLDLQQTQPLPRLSTNEAFYKRKMWLYNLCIYDLKKNKSNAYVWVR